MLRLGVVFKTAAKKTMPMRGPNANSSYLSCLHFLAGVVPLAGHHVAERVSNRKYIFETWRKGGLHHGVIVSSHYWTGCVPLSAPYFSRTFFGNMVSFASCTIVCQVGWWGWTVITFGRLPYYIVSSEFVLWREGVGRNNWTIRRLTLSFAVLAKGRESCSLGRFGVVVERV